MGNKRLISATIGATAAALLMSACGGGGSANKGDSSELVIGVPIDLTGPTGPYGTAEKNGMEIAVAMINEDPPNGRKVKLVFRDSASQPASTLSATQQLINSKPAPEGIVAGVGGASIAAVSPLLKSSGLPTIFGYVGTAGIMEGSDCAIRINYSDPPLVAGALTSAVKKYDLKTIAIVSANDPFDETGRAAFKAAAKANGLTVSDDKVFAAGDTNLQAVLTGTIASKPDALAIAALSADAVTAARQARQLGFDGPIIGNSGFGGNTVTDALGKASGTIVVGSGYTNESETPGNDEFVKAYQDEFDEKPNVFAANAFDSVNYMVQLLSSSGGDASASDRCKELRATTSVEGVGGTREMALVEDGGLDVAANNATPPPTDVGFAVVSQDGGPFEPLS